MTMRDKKDNNKYLNINNKKFEIKKDKNYPYCWDIDDNIFSGYSKSPKIES